MWQSQRSSLSHTDNPDLVTDSASGQQLRSRTYPHGVSTPSTGVAEQQQWKSAGYLTKEPSSPSSTKGQSDCGLYDSGRTDSGFISGQNLTSEQCLSSDDLTSSHNITDSSIQDPYDKEKDHKNLMRLDSGVDVGLHENFSGLSLDTHTSLNDLNSSSKSQSHDSSAPFTNINVHSSSSGSRTSSSSTPSQQTTSQQQLTQSNQSFAPAWELYFQQDQDGDTQLHIAIIQGFIEVVYSLVQMVPHPCFLDILNDVCQTPLHLAVLTRQPRIARRLLVAGATVDVRDSNGNTALHLACQTGNLDCVKALTEPITVAETATANLRYIPYLQQVPQNLEARNYDGE
uniref:NF-kappa-B inhibitor cactus n=1 Tax=Timema tahoe TaxID=61484 RepID=A0A7R9IB69_9NEOP|nr:unnamed protein product [Timema tahoe]